MRNLVLLVPFLVVGVLFTFTKLRKSRAVEVETQERARLASQNIKEDLDAKRRRDDLRTNWDNEHLILSNVSHETVVIGGIVVSCPTCQER